MTMHRRRFLTAAARSGLVLPFARPLPVLGQPRVFAHGVASGDPLSDRVLLWTRVSGSTDDRVPVGWEVARDPDFRETVAAGETATGPERDYTVKVTAPGLEPGMTYHYRFEALGETVSRGPDEDAPAGLDPCAARLRLLLQPPLRLLPRVPPHRGARAT